MQFESCKYANFLFILQSDLEIRRLFLHAIIIHITNVLSFLRFLNPLSVQNLLILVSLLSYMLSYGIEGIENNQINHSASIYIQLLCVIIN